MRVVLLLGAILALTVALNAQTEVLRAHVPFAFEAGGKLLPAGDYRISKEETSNVLVMQGGSGNSAAFLTRYVEQAKLAGSATLIFARHGATTSLSEIRLPGNHSRVLLASPPPVKTEVVSSISATSVSSR
jgi:hypothetical protein